MAVERRGLRVKGKNATLPSTAVWRLLDANANRAREGLRVIEDTARFILENAEAAKAFRTMRHSLDQLVRQHYHKLLEARNVQNDSGRANLAEPYKDGIHDLLVANIKRVEEALRVIEEYGRVLAPRAVRKAQSLRFEVYVWEFEIFRLEKERNKKMRAKDVWRRR